MTAPSGADGATKWQVAVEALHQFLQNAEQRTRFGLLLFPDTAGEACGQDAITVPISDGAATTMKGLLAAALATSNSLFPAGPCVTNIDAAIAKAATEAALREESRRSFVVLVTDGKQEACNAAGGDSGTLAVIRDLHAAGIDTFVVGFGSGVDKNQLGVWAVEGGQPNSSGTAKYFDAANKTELASAFQTIARRTISCTMGLATKPPADDSASIFVFTGDDEHPLTRDPSHLSGWDYDPKAGAVTLYGDACRALQDGLTDEVHILLGCPGGPPPNAAIR